MNSHAPALENAIACHRQGALDEAAAVYRDFTQNQPELAEPWHLLGVVEMQQGRLECAITLFREALAREPEHFKCLSNLGGAFYRLERFDEAVEALRTAVRLSPDYVNAVFNLGNALLATGKLEDAAQYFRKALELRADYPEAENNLAEVLKLLKRFDEAASILQSALARHPDNALLTKSLVELLNGYMPPPDARGPLAQAQSVLQGMAVGLNNGGPASDEDVGVLYRHAKEVLEGQSFDPEIRSTQLWRGVTDDPGCQRHMKVFKTFNAIPEYCFSCFKVQIEVPTVVDLFKLFFVFDRIELPGDSTRKCIVETRPGMPGFYKGLVYCENGSDPHATLQAVKDAVEAGVSADALVALKRGCSEFPIAYPEYAKITEDGAGMMAYPEEWRRHEEHVDRHMNVYSPPLAFDSHNHPGLSLKDVAVMRTWLAYAVAIGDESYLAITGQPVAPMVLKDRPPFQPPGA